MGDWAFHLWEGMGEEGRPVLPKSCYLLQNFKFKEGEEVIISIRLLQILSSPNRGVQVYSPLPIHLFHPFPCPSPPYLRSTTFKKLVGVTNQLITHDLSNIHIFGMFTDNSWSRMKSNKGKQKGCVPALNNDWMRASASSQERGYMIWSRRVPKLV